MSQVFWQAKIWALLHDSALKVLHAADHSPTQDSWLDWVSMQGWPTAENAPELCHSEAFQQIQQAHNIAAASDRGAISNLSDTSVEGLEQPPAVTISHLFSGEQQTFDELSEENRALILEHIQNSLETVELIDPTDGERKPLGEIQDSRKVAWWLWRCLPIQAGRAVSDDATSDKRGNQLLLLPAEARLPDCSVWSYASITAALASGLTGYEGSVKALQALDETVNLPKVSIATFSFTPVQELIKASRKMRDFWAGSWVLHYLSAKIAWKVAQKYGPDSLLYPSLFQQPLIDYWLLHEGEGEGKNWSDFSEWVEEPSHRQLLTAGFPNVLVFVLPEKKVKGAMQCAEQTLKEEWRFLGDKVLDQLHDRYWMRNLQKDYKTWRGWLETQWQTYWSAVAVGDRNQPLTSHEALDQQGTSDWVEAQNQVCQLRKGELFSPEEATFLQKAAELNGPNSAEVNVGSWWPHAFAQTRRSLMAVKSARPWTLPTAFSNRSSISGWGPAVHTDDWQSDVDTSKKRGPDWIPEETLQKLWRDPAGTFDGREQLNATEVLKRGLQKILPELFTGLFDKEKDIDSETQELKAYYPDLTAGVAGYLKRYQSQPDHLAHYRHCCQELRQALHEQKGEFNLTRNWGIPWVDEPSQLDEKQRTQIQEFHPRHLNAGWLAEEAITTEIKELEKSIREDKSGAKIDKCAPELQAKRRELLEQRRRWRDEEFKPTINKYYPEGKSPADWYVMAAGDGDGMSNWLKGKNLEPYQQYMPPENTAAFQAVPELQGLLNQTKRMGPATHSALSRALLDFSNQLLPYLTEERYAGRLIYGGGDDVLAYSNLWEWDQWLMDVCRCFRGGKDPKGQFIHQGDYWRWNPEKGKLPERISARPLFTMGRKATISFGIVVANQAVPLAISLENLWEAEAEAKDHYCDRPTPTDSNSFKQPNKKDAVQVRVLYGNGNILKATAKFDAFIQWRDLVERFAHLEPAIFEQAAALLNQHPIPVSEAIELWSIAFCDRRDAFAGKEEQKQAFCEALSQFIRQLWHTTQAADRDTEIQTWLKLAAFMIRKRTITLGVKQEVTANAMV